VNAHRYFAASASLLTYVASDGNLVSSTEDVVGATAYPYSREVLVEVTCRDDDDHLVFYSYAFEPCDDGVVSPNESVADRHISVVVDALDDENDDLETDVAGAPS